MKSEFVLLLILWGAPLIAGAQVVEPAPGTAAALAATGLLPDERLDADPNAPQHRPVARIGQALIRYSDLWYWVRKNPNSLTTFGSQAGRDTVLNTLIKGQLLGAAADERFAGDPAEMAKPAAEKIRSFRRRYLATPSDISDAERHAYYDHHVAELGIPPMLRIRELFFPTSANGSPQAARAQAAAVQAELKAGASFEGLAAKYAPDYPSKLAGGDRGFLSIVDRPLLGDLTATMAPGDISDPVELPEGFSILQFIDRRAAVPATFDEVDAEIKRRVLAEREAALLDQFYLAEARKRGVEILVPDFANAWPSSTATVEPTQPTE